MKALSLLSLGLACLVTGCASLPSKTEIDCTALDWHALGVADGTAGRYAYEVGRYKKRCPAIKPELAVWEAGRSEGLKSYCTKANAFALGQSGRNFNQVCPEEGLLELQQSYSLGYQQYYQRQRLETDLWRPFGVLPAPFHPFW